MRIGMVTACYKPVINGVTHMISQYKERLEQAGHHVTVFTLGVEDPDGDQEGIVRSPAVPLGSTGYYLALRYSRDARKMMGQMDVVHCHHLLMGLEFAYRYSECPVVYTNHTRYDLYLGHYSPLKQPARDTVMRRLWPALTDFSDVVIAPSNSLRNLLLAFGVRKPVEVIFNGVDLATFNNPTRPWSKEELGVPEQATLLAYVGRLSTEKNILALIDEFALARRNRPDLFLALAGDGPLFDKLKHKTAELNIQSHTLFLGALDYAEVPNFLAAADIFVTTSQSEVHPLTIIEALATGLPVVAIDSPGIADIVEDGKTGILCSAKSGEVAKKLVEIAADAGRRQAMGRAAIEASRRFDIDKTVSQTIELYERLLTERPDLDSRVPGWRSLSKEITSSWQALGAKLLPSEENRAGRHEQ